MGESKIRKCIICGRLITASRRYAYCSDECASYASKERARAKMREIQEEHRKFITETRQKKNMKKPGKKSKQYRNELIRIAAEAREHGMSYGQYVELMYCEERDEMERRRRYDRKRRERFG